MKFRRVGAQKIEGLIRENHPEAESRTTRVAFKNADLNTGKAQLGEYGCVEPSWPGTQNFNA
jgi:hypothetical protein